MCRWFAYIGTKNIVLEDVLINPPHAITEMVDHRYLPGLVEYPNHSSIDNIDANTHHNQSVLQMNHRMNHDGFGMAWYSSFWEKNKDKLEGKSAVGASLYRTEILPKTDLNFISICQNNESRCILAHVRAATSHPIVRTNNHPFSFGRHTIMHNGYITFFSKIRKFIIAEVNHRILSMVYGNTDSEHLAALYLTYLTEDTHHPDFNKAYPKERMQYALLKAVNFVLEQQQAVKLDAFDEAELEEIYRTQRNFNWANNLNVCVSDGERLVAMRYRNDSGHHPATLYYSTSSGIKLARDFSTSPVIEQDDASVAQEKEALKAYGPHLIVSSEPTTWVEGDWTLIERNVITAVNLKEWESGDKQTLDENDIRWEHVNSIFENVDRDVPKPEGWSEWSAEYKKKHKQPSHKNHGPPKPPKAKAYKFNHTMIRVADLEKSKDFYTKVLGMEVVRTEGNPLSYFLAYDQHHGKLSDRQKNEQSFYREGVLEISPHGGLSNPADHANTAIQNGVPESKPEQLSPSMPRPGSVPGLGLGHFAITLDSLAGLNKFHEHFNDIGAIFEKQPTEGRPIYITELRDPDGYTIRLMAPAAGGHETHVGV